MYNRVYIAFGGNVFTRTEERKSEEKRFSLRR